MTAKDIGFLQHGAGTQGPFRTEAVNVRMSEEWPTAGLWSAFFEGKWRRVHVQVKRLYIIFQGSPITIQIEGV